MGTIKQLYLIGKNVLKNESGNVAPLVGFCLLALVAMTGLVIDGGTLYMTHSHLQKTANASVLSGAQELSSGEYEVRRIVDDVLDHHGETNSFERMEIEGASKVTVYLEKDVDLSFMRVFGYNQSRVKVSATAERLSMGRSMGAAPLGIDDTTHFEYYREYTLKVDEEDVETGNFGALALGTPGGRSFLTNLKYGFREEIKVGDVLQTEPGNNVGPAREGVQYRINNCPYSPGEVDHKDCPRVILIPIYAKNEFTGRSEVVVTGFAYFYISSPVNMGDKTIRGQFLERTGTGYFEEGADSRGAYVIRLTN